MSVILTRDEFEDAVDDLIVAVQIDRGHETDRDYLLAAYDALAARIEEMEDERRIRITNLQAIESHANWQAARIAELEAAIDALTLSGADCYALVLALEEREEKYRLRIAELEAALSKEALTEIMEGTGC